MVSQCAIRQSNTLESDLDSVLCMSIRRNYRKVERVAQQQSCTIDWENVSRELQMYLGSLIHSKHAPHGTTSWIDHVEHFTPGVCRQRARYIVWCHIERNKAIQKRSRGNTCSPLLPTTTPIPHNGHTSKTNMDIFHEIAGRLPTILSTESDAAGSEDEEDGTTVSLKEFTKEDPNLIASISAEERQLQRFQEAELQYFKTTGTWFAAHPVETMSQAEVASLLDQLGLSEHRSSFRRTDGALLLTMDKDDVVRRFHPDAEAADILWSYLTRSRTLHPSQPIKNPSKESTRTDPSSKMLGLPSTQEVDKKSMNSSIFDEFELDKGLVPGKQTVPTSASKADLQEKLADLNEYELRHSTELHGGEDRNTKLESSGRQGHTHDTSLNLQDPTHDLTQALKRKLFPNRPLRPSQERTCVPHVDPHEIEMPKDAASLHSDPPQKKGMNTDVSSKHSSKTESKPPQRPGRWTVIEYSEEEEEEV